MKKCQSAPTMRRPGRLTGESNVTAGSFAKVLRVVWRVGNLLRSLFRSALTPPYEGKELLRQMDEIGSKSLPLVALAGAAMGVVLTLHTRDSLIRFGAKSILPTIIVLSIIKETGPIITRQSREPSLTVGLLNGSEAQVSSPRVSKGFCLDSTTYATLTRPCHIHARIHATICR